jgi:hypothetical protein
MYYVTKAPEIDIYYVYAHVIYLLDINLNIHAESNSEPDIYA